MISYLDLFDCLDREQYRKAFQDEKELIQYSLPLQAPEFHGCRGPFHKDSLNISRAFYPGNDQKKKEIRDIYTNLSN